MLVPAHGDRDRDPAGALEHSAFRFLNNNRRTLPPRGVWVICRLCAGFGNASQLVLHGRREAAAQPDGGVCRHSAFRRRRALIWRCGLVRKPRFYNGSPAHRGCPVRAPRRSRIYPGGGRATPSSRPGGPFLHSNGVSSLERLLDTGKTRRDCPGGHKRADCGEQFRPRTSICSALGGHCSLDDFLAGEDLLAGRLRRVLPNWNFHPVPVFALTPSRVMPAKTRAFVEFLAAGLKNSRTGVSRGLSSTVA